MIFETLLEDFKRANLAAKNRLAAKFGFPSPAAYLKYLEDSIATPKGVEESPTDMVIAFDTTGSMGAYIAAVRNHVVETINNLFDNTPNLKLKIVAFGDYCDMEKTKNGYILGNAYQETDLTDDRKLLIEFVREAKNTGGGDGPEFYELVLNKILNETPWREGANKAILLIGDSTPHEVGYSLHPYVQNARIDWRTEARKASEMMIRVDTLRIHSDVDWYQKLSTMTNGACMNFQSAGKTQKIVEAATYMTSRSKMSLNSMKASYKAASAAGDDELVGAYKAMGKSRGIDIDKL